MAAEAVLCVRVGGLWRRKGWETTGSQTPTKTDNVGGKTAYAAWAGTAQRSERRTDGQAGYNGLRELAHTFELRYFATTLMRSENRRSLRPVYPDFVCANSAGALCPGSPEGFAAFLPRTDRSDAERTRGPPAEQK